MAVGARCGCEHTGLVWFGLAVGWSSIDDNELSTFMGFELALIVRGGKR